MVWSPSASHRRIGLLASAGDYTTLNFHHFCDSTNSSEGEPLRGIRDGLRDCGGSAAKRIGAIACDRSGAEALRRRILMENPSAYLRFRHSPIPEAEFLISEDANFQRKLNTREIRCETARPKAIGMIFSSA
jgi:hypothetical protein